jgi:hypothetical protein
MFNTSRVINQLGIHYNQIYCAIILKHKHWGLLMEGIFTRCGERVDFREK